MVSFTPGRAGKVQQEGLQLLDRDQPTCSGSQAQEVAASVWPGLCTQFMEQAWLKQAPSFCPPAGGLGEGDPPRAQGENHVMLLRFLVTEREQNVLSSL